MHPGPKALATAQDRLVEKNFLRELGIPTAPYLESNNATALGLAIAELQPPAVLKTARFGYDGKGQVLITADSNIEDAYQAMGAQRGVLEKWIDFKMEISVIIARRADGTTAYHSNGSIDLQLRLKPVPIVAWHHSTDTIEIAHPRYGAQKRCPVNAGRMRS